MHPALRHEVWHRHDADNEDCIIAAALVRIFGGGRNHTHIWVFYPYMGAPVVLTSSSSSSGGGVTNRLLQLFRLNVEMSFYYQKGVFKTSAARYILCIDS